MRLVAIIMMMPMMLTMASCSTWFGILESDPPDVQMEEEGDDYLPQPDEFVPVEVPPVMIYCATPDYPRLAYQAGIEGVVWVQALVDKHGVVREAQVGKSSGTVALDEAAVRAAYLCRYTPGIQNGRPIACWVSYRVEFVIDG